MVPAVNVRVVPSCPYLGLYLGDDHNKALRGRYRRSGAPVAVSSR